MSTITWNELKEKVEQELDNAGFNGDIEIEYIDFGSCVELDDIDVYVDNDGLTIC